MNRCSVAATRSFVFGEATYFFKCTFKYMPKRGTFLPSATQGIPHHDVLGLCCPPPQDHHHGHAAHLRPMECTFKASEFKLCCLQKLGILLDSPVSSLGEELFLHEPETLVSLSRLSFFSISTERAPFPRGTLAFLSSSHLHTSYLPCSLPLILQLVSQIYFLGV